MAKLKGAAKAKFLARMNKGRIKAGLKRIGSKTKAAVKRRTTKKRKAPKKRTTRTKSRSSTKKSVAGKKGTSGMTRTKKFLLGIGIGSVVSTIAAFSRVREIESAGPIIDAAVGGGVEAQIGTAIPRLIRLVAGRTGFNGGGNGIGSGSAGPKNVAKLNGSST